MVEFIDDIVNFLDGFVGWLPHYSTTRILHTYWFLLFVEFPRYYVLEYLVVFYRWLTRDRRFRRREEAPTKLRSEQPLVSILVPGKNEGAHIYKMVKSLAEQTYRNYEIIVVDDGSDDLTPLSAPTLSAPGSSPTTCASMCEAARQAPPTSAPAWPKASTLCTSTPTHRSTAPP